MLDIELNESLRRRREELRGKIENLADADDGNAASSTSDLDSRNRELATLTASIENLGQKITGAAIPLSLLSSNALTLYSYISIEMESDVEKSTSELRKKATALENAQTEQTENNRGISRQQKNTERYLTKRQMLTSRKDECSKNIRDLGVLPEEAFEKYTGVKPDRVRASFINENVSNFNLISGSLLNGFMPSMRP